MSAGILLPLSQKTSPPPPTVLCVSIVKPRGMYVSSSDDQNEGLPTMTHPFCSEESVIRTSSSDGSFLSFFDFTGSSDFRNDGCGSFFFLSWNRSNFLPSQGRRQRPRASFGSRKSNFFFFLSRLFEHCSRPCRQRSASLPTIETLPFPPRADSLRFSFQRFPVAILE